jgi:hypothetical protein
MSQLRYLNKHGRADLWIPGDTGGVVLLYVFL